MENDSARQPLRKQISVKLVALAGLVNRERLGASMRERFVSLKGRSATSSRLIAGSLYLQHAFDFSDEEVVCPRVENLHWQVFTSENCLQTRPSMDSFGPKRWRKRRGKGRADALLAATIEAGKRAGVIKVASVNRVIVDTTVMERAIIRPTGSRLTERCREYPLR